MTVTSNIERCTRCDEPLAEGAVTWLELNFKTNRYHAEGSVAASESQGCFPFGHACAQTVRAAGGVNSKIRGAA